jgi:3-deoxy-7-phosphoheptulonate synthase
MPLPYKEALQRLENSRVKATRPLIPPQILQEDLPLSVGSTSRCCCPAETLKLCFRSFMAANTVLEGRCATENILRGDDDRLMVVVGYALFHHVDSS